MKNEALCVENLYQQISEVLQAARANIYRQVNFTMVQAYWNIGRIVVEEEQGGRERAEYGEFLLRELSTRLTSEFGKGFSLSNLKYMRQFFLAFPISHAVGDQSVEVIGHAVRDQLVTSLKDYILRSELTWTHYRLLLKIRDEQARTWYMNEAANENWSTRQLDRQISALYYERLLASSDKEPVQHEAVEKLAAVSPEEFIHDPYVLEFLGLQEYPSLREAGLEQALIDKLQLFLLELGKGFSFVARQKRIRFDNDDFYIDLVFYNYILKCFVLIDLKTGKLNHQDIGQMDSYVRVFEEHCKGEGDNPTIGLILCAEKNEAMAKYSVLKESKQLFASKYLLYLPSEAELKAELERERKVLDIL
ncbi:PDDEXK nuclease domain-containing protein [Oligoflexia bacterium]|nr:PDDEXK nuclease domain-containing protein [Oligoflexia bacterium]